MKQSVFSFLSNIKIHEVFTHIYKNSSESSEIASRYILEGLRAGQKCIFISDTGLPRGIISRLQNNSLGIDKKNIENNVRDIKIMNIGNNTNYQYCAFLEQSQKKIIAESTNKNSSPSRVIVSKDPAFVQNYDSFDIKTTLQINNECKKLPIILMYQFHLNRISSKDLMSILKLNRHVIENDYAYKSVFYQPDRNIPQGDIDKKNINKVLTIQEKKVLNGIINGLSNKKIAVNLSLSTRTVESHRANIMKKLKVNNLVDLVKFAIKKGLI